MTRTLLAMLIATTLPTLAACDVDVEDEGEVELPRFETEGGDVELPKVEVTGGDVELPKVRKTADGELRAPDIDVRGPDVDVGTKTVDMKVPTVDVTLPKEGEKGEVEQAAEAAAEELED